MKVKENFNNRKTMRHKQEKNMDNQFSYEEKKKTRNG